MGIKRIIACFLAVVLCLTAVSFISQPKTKAASSPIENNAVYYIKNKRTGKYLTASSLNSGASLFMSNYTGSTLQQFKFVYAETSSGNIYYNIILNAASNLRLDVKNASNTDGNTIGLFQNNPSYPQAQRFRFILTNSSTGQNSYRIMPKLSTTRVLSVSSQLDGGNPIMLYGVSSLYNQDWILERTTLDMSITGNLRINQQETGSTCGCACVRNILSNFNVIRSEGAIVNYAQDLASTSPGTDITYVWVLKDTLNRFLSVGNTGVQYDFYQTSNFTLTDYKLYLSILLYSNCPIMFNGNFSANSYVPYGTTGHYVVCSGVKTPAGSTDWTAIISDPYMYNGSVYAGIWEMPLSVLRTTNQSHSSHGYMIAASSIS